MGVKMIKLESQEERIQDWKKCLFSFSDFSPELIKQMSLDYLHEVWKIQEIDGNLPKEFEGFQ